MIKKIPQNQKEEEEISLKLIKNLFCESSFVIQIDYLMMKLLVKLVAV